MRLVAPHLGRGLVVAEAEVARVAEPPVVRPLAEADLRDEPRLDPLDVGRSRRAAASAARRTATSRGGAALSSASSLVDLGVVEAGADVADVAQPAGVVARRGRARRSCRARCPVPRV